MTGFRKTKKVFFKDYPDEFIVVRGLTKEKGLELEDIISVIPKKMNEKGEMENDVTTKEGNEALKNVFIFMCNLLPDVLLEWSMRDDDGNLWSKEKVIEEINDNFNIVLNLVNELTPFFKGGEEQEQSKKK